MNIVNQDIFDQYKHLFSEDAKEAMNIQKATGVIIQYNRPTGLVKKGYDPNNYYPHSSVSLSKDVGKQKWNLYRTFCKLGIEFSYSREIALVKFFGLAVSSKKDISRAAEIVAENINSLAKAGAIRGHLDKLSYLKLAPINPEHNERYIVYSYVGIKDIHNYKKHLKNINIEFQEGAVPTELENL